MSSGYTPLFQTVLEGTLFGKWPHTGIWTCLLSQCDRHGCIDQHPALLAAKIGVPVDLLLQCITDFMAPDPASRTGDMDGRRLELIDASSREWGWRVINHSLYREKARKQAYDKERTESGRDAKRKQENRSPATSRDVPMSPATSPAIPLSESDSKKERERPSRRVKQAVGTPLPEDFSPSENLQLFATERLRDVEIGAMTEQFRAHHTSAGTLSKSWDASWRTWVLNAVSGFKYPRQEKPSTTVNGMEGYRW